MNKGALKQKDKEGISGSFVMRTHEKGAIPFTLDADGKVRVTDISALKAAIASPYYEHPRTKNKVVSASGGYGRNLILRRLSGDTTYGFQIDSGAIGTNSTAAADGDTALIAPVLTGITVALYELSNDSLTISFFIPDGILANGTYAEFALYIGTQLFARAVISPSFVKTTGLDTTIEYTISLAST